MYGIEHRLPLSFLWGSFVGRWVEQPCGLARAIAILRFARAKEFGKS